MTVLVTGCDRQHVARLAVGGRPVEVRALALADGEAERAVVPAEHRAGGGVDDVAGPLAEPAGAGSRGCRRRR